MNFTGFTFTDIIMVCGFVLTIGVMKGFLSERAARTKEDMDGVIATAKELETKHEARTVRVEEKFDKLAERIFDQIEARQTIEACREWRDNTCGILDDIRIEMRSVQAKLDKYLVNGNATKKAGES